MWSYYGIQLSGCRLVELTGNVRLGWGGNIKHHESAIYRKLTDFIVSQHLLVWTNTLAYYRVLTLRIRNTGLGLFTLQVKLQVKQPVGQNVLAPKYFITQSKNRNGTVIWSIQKKITCHPLKLISQSHSVNIILFNINFCLISFNVCHK